MLLFIRRCLLRRDRTFGHCNSVDSYCDKYFVQVNVMRSTISKIKSRIYALGYGANDFVDLSAFSGWPFSGTHVVSNSHPTLPSQSRTEVSC